VPIHDYKCPSCGLLFEELFLGSDVVPDTLGCPSCQGSSDRQTVNWFRHIGPVFEHLDSYTDAMYTEKQRASGKRIRSYKDVQAFERDNRLDRVTFDSPIYRQQVEKTNEEMFEMRTIKNDSGRVGVADYIYKKEMQDVTGWSDMKYSRWKNQHDSAKKSAESGKVDISQLATAKPVAAST